MNCVCRSELKLTNEFCKEPFQKNDFHIVFRTKKKYVSGIFKQNLKKESNDHFSTQCTKLQPSFEERNDQICLFQQNAIKLNMQI